MGSIWPWCGVTQVCARRTLRKQSLQLIAFLLDQLTSVERRLEGDERFCLRSDTLWAWEWPEAALLSPRLLSQPHLNAGAFVTASVGLRGWLVLFDSGCISGWLYFRTDNPTTHATTVIYTDDVCLSEKKRFAWSSRRGDRSSLGPPIQLH